ncbi:hypothetical protein L596_028119 [Steinernema carpocapsae]|uniref:Uncharacterized protein n=1 Tax=Steinernema carpocapsae TaxID=34508 RepID=A0A4U5LXG5_STECR|nr:hypothetical protein L596_028119 [Steinernema carpocapsae]
MSERSRRRVPSSSFDDSDDNMVSADPAAALENSYMKQIAVEKILSEVKEMFHAELLRQVEFKRDQLLNHKDPDFITKRDKLRAEYEAKLEVVRANRQLKHDQLERVYTAEQGILDEQYERDKQLIVFEVRNQIIEKKRELLRQLVDAKQQMAEYLARGPEALRQQMEDDRIDLDAVLEEEIFARNKRKKPIVVVGLHPADIESDLAVITSAVTVKREKEDLEMQIGL